MVLPFTQAEFFNVFSQYNNDVYPIQIIFVLVALFILLVVYKRYTKLYTFVWFFIAFLWMWGGIVYHIGFFSQINPIARYFGLIFIIEALLLVYYGAIKKIIEFDTKLPKTSTYMGVFLIIYSLLMYPLITIFTGHNYPILPTFGVPCPTTIYTIGLFLLTDLNKTPKKLFVIPIIWTLVGTTAAFKLNVYADTMLIVSSLFLITALFINKGRKEEV